MRRTLAVLLFVLLSVAANTAFAQSEPPPIPSSRIVVERDVDFYGADLRSIFDTTFDACRAACENDRSCGAFTFNSRSNSCFPKRGVDRREPYVGAISGLVLPQPQAVLARATSRAADLDFLRQDDLTEARNLASALPLRHAPGSEGIDSLLGAANAARGSGDLRGALRYGGAALVLTDLASHWRQYAEDSLAVTSNDRNEMQRLQAAALPAAVNAYLRADSSAERSRSLVVIAQALERQRRGRAMIPALRLADSLAPGGQIAAALNDAIGKYGFHIDDTQVDSDAVRPRLCANFSDPLAKGVDYAPYVQLPGVSFAAEAEDRQLCLEGVSHGERYQVTFRAGLPAASGETLVRDTTVALYVRDRSPTVRFPGRAYVLPRASNVSVPVVTVNLTEITLSLHQVSDRNLRQLMEENYFGRPLSAWDVERFDGALAEEVWRGSGEVERVLNTEVTTQMPIGEALKDLPAGLYALQARIEGSDPYENPGATQWFVVSDLGLATMSGADGLHVFVRSLASADPLPGVSVNLVSRSNRVLGQGTTDAQGYLRFPPDLAGGTGAASPALIVAETGPSEAPDDLAFLSLTDPEFDLSDRGAEGRLSAGAIDLFLATDRGAYRAGETIHATVLARDVEARAIDDLPLTAILTRADGVEYSRTVSNGGVAGGHVFDLPVGGTVPRGTWQLAIHADPEAAPLAQTRLLVEDFLPERIDVTLEPPKTPLLLDGASGELIVQADYLFGAPGADLPLEGEIVLQATSGLAAWPDYQFGLHDERFEARYSGLDAGRTDAAGQAIVALNLPEVDDVSRPLEASVTVRVSEGSGRPVERRTTIPVTVPAPVIGIKPLYADVVPQGAEASFDLLGIAPDGTATPMRVKWTLNRIEREYQWYARYGNWEWEPTTRRSRVTQGEASLGAAPLSVSAPVDWGTYELVVERLDGPYAASAVKFYAGWYAPADATASPDTLDVSLDQPGYRSGDTATLRIVPRVAGKVLVTVVSNRLIAMETVEVAEAPVDVTLPVTDEWGAGAYVTATLIQPMDVATGRNPTRALGLSYAAVDPGASKLGATFEVPEAVRPRGPLDVVLRVDNLPAGQKAWATIAAVDQGILNLTGHQPPDASAHYFGQRRLGMALRDLYGRLIDGQTGATGRLRSGGDATAQMRLEAPPPTEELVTYFSGPVEVGADGAVRTTFDLPSFNGKLRLMAVVWSGDAVGEADAEVLVRDPVVVTATLPRFLAPGDTGRLLLEVLHADGAEGSAPLTISAMGVEPDRSTIPAEIAVVAGRRSVLSIPVTASMPGLATVEVALTTPGGERLVKTLTLPVQVNDPETSRTTRFELASGASFNLTPDVFDGLRPGTGTATVALGPLARIDAPGLLRLLDRYPYGCTEQVTSQALPLLYFAPMARALGLDAIQTVDLRISQAIDRVLSRQNNEGGFGLWQTYDGDLWLDAYATDFLSRARALGHAVPDLAFRSAVDNLRNGVNTAPDFGGDSGNGGEALAYALMVLAREGAAAIGDLRYYSDAKVGDFGTPLAVAQLGAALASYGEQPRADALFRRAEAMLTQGGDSRQWRVDYGTGLRDSAAVLALATEAGSAVIDRAGLIDDVSSPGRALSTQEAAWSLLAAHSLVERATGQGFSLNGAPVDLPVLRISDREATVEQLILNGSGAATELTLTTFGVPEGPVQADGNGYAIERAYYTTDGAAADPRRVSQGTRLVAVLTVTPFGGGEARLMVSDPLPAGFEIDNPNLLRGGDIDALDWLQPAQARHAEFRQDRFLAAVDWRSDAAFRLAYIVRAVSPGDYHHPAASVEDMYRPQYRANTDSSRVTVAK